MWVQLVSECNGQGIDDLHDALVSIEADGSQFLCEKFVDVIFSKINSDDGILDDGTPITKTYKQLGIQSANVDRLDYHYKREKEMATKFAEQIREYLEIDENTCRYKNETLTRCS